MLERGEDPPRRAAVQRARVGQRGRRRRLRRGGDRREQLGRAVDRLDPAVDRRRAQRSACAITVALYEPGQWISPTPPSSASCSARAAALAAEIMVHEDDCEAANGLPPRGPRGGRRPRARARPERDQHAGRVGRRGALRARPGDRAGAARAAHQRAVGHGLAARQRAARVRRRRSASATCSRASAASGATASRSPSATPAPIPRAIATTATPVDGGFAIDGEKWFVTVGDAADYMIVLALVLPERAPTLFLIDKDTPGVAVQRTPRYMHTFVYEHPEFGFTDVRVGGGRRARRHRPGLRADARLVRRGAADDRRARDRRRRAGAADGDGVGGGARPGRRPDRRPPADPGR